MVLTDILHHWIGCHYILRRFWFSDNISCKPCVPLTLSANTTIRLTFVGFFCWHHLIIVWWIARNLIQRFMFPSNKFKAALSCLTVCQQLLHYYCFSFITSSEPPRDSFAEKEVWRCLLFTCITLNAYIERLCMHVRHTSAFECH